MRAIVFTLVLIGMSAVGADAPIARAWLPNRWIAQAEVQWHRKGTERWVRSIIHSRVPDRVKARIISNERRNWPEHPDAQSYIVALEEAFTLYKSRSARRPDTALLIDFVQAPDATEIRLSFAAVESLEGGWLPKALEPWKTLKADAAYVTGNQKLIIRDAFGSEADRILQDAP